MALVIMSVLCTIPIFHTPYAYGTYILYAYTCIVQIYIYLKMYRILYVIDFYLYRVYYSKNVQYSYLYHKHTSLVRKTHFFFCFGDGKSIKQHQYGVVFSLKEKHYDSP